MIIRIVRMTFDPDKTDEFLHFFDEVKEKIRHVEGCLHLEILQDVTERNILTTYSHWKSEQALEAYRNSSLFNTIWPKTKSYFSDKPQAFSFKKILK